MEAVTGQATLNLILGADSLQYLPHCVLGGAVAAELQVPQHSLILTLLEVGEEEQVGGDAPELVFITQLH